MCVDSAVFGVLFSHLARVGLSWLGEEGGWSGSRRCRLSKSVDTGEKMEDIHIMAGDKDTKRPKRVTPALALLQLQKAFRSIFIQRADQTSSSSAALGHQFHFQSVGRGLLKGRDRNHDSSINPIPPNGHQPPPPISIATGHPFLLEGGR
jgi:hypothetical protein